MSRDVAAVDNSEDTKVLRVNDSSESEELQRGGEMECLTAEFRHRLGLLPEEEQELSDIFKIKLGLCDIDDDRLTSLIEDKERTTKHYSLDKFAQSNFQKSGRYSVIKFIEHEIVQPLLIMDDPRDFQASIYIFSAIKRYLKGHFCQSTGICSKPYIPVMHKVQKVMEIFSQTTPHQPISAGATIQPKEYKSNKSKKQSSLRKLLRTIGKSYSKKASRQTSSATDTTENFISMKDQEVDLPVTYEDLLSSINWELELVQFIVSHGIIKKELRDEIFCQLCCMVKNNPSREETERGWLLHALCSSCFLPSQQLIGHYASFLHQMSGTTGCLVQRVMHNLLRRNRTGPRYQPPNFVELKAEKEQTSIKFNVHLIDGIVVDVDVDSLSTSQEICESVSNHINLNDTFGFSLYIASYERVSSMGSGGDHVMDVVTECEHMALDRNEFCDTRPCWILSFRKELFTPWFDPELDLVSTELIYKQIKEGFFREEFKISKGMFEMSMAQILYIEYGNLNQDLVRQKLPAHVPNNRFADTKAVETASKNVMDVGTKMALDIGSLDRKEIRCMFVRNVARSLPLNFSALFEAFNYGGFPQIPRQDVILAINNRGIDVLGSDTTKVLAHINYSDIYIATDDCPQELANHVLILVTADGREFTLATPNAEVASKITNAFLSGLRKRSRWAVAVKNFVYKDFRMPTVDKEFELHMGDTIELLDEIDKKTEDESQELLYGICERTGLNGSFPEDVVYIIPTDCRPSQEFLDALKAVGNSFPDEDQPMKSRVIMSDADTIRRKSESSA